MNRPELTVIIPAYNEAARLPATLEHVLRYLREKQRRFEVIVVDDGSVDATHRIAGQFADRGVRVVRLECNRGKGAALRAGVLVSRGRRVLLTDADLSTPIEEVERMERAASEAQVVVGSRAVPESNITLHQPRYRESMGSVFNWLLRRLGLTTLRDTQCGFKLIDGDVARGLFRDLRTTGFAWDVELLFLASRRRYSILELGVQWRNDPDSRVRTWLDAPRMLWDVLKLRVQASRWGQRAPPADPEE